MHSQNALNIEKLKTLLLYINRAKLFHIEMHSNIV